MHTELIKKALQTYNSEGLRTLFLESGSYIHNNYLPDIISPQYGYVQTLSNPTAILAHFRQTVIRPMNETILNLQHTNERGIDIMKEDWDNLIILDACRADIFKQLCSVDERVEEKRAIAPRTPLFIERTFADEQYHDTVYITSNPHVERIAGEHTFHNLHQLWKQSWSDKYQSVLPKDVTRQAKKIAERYPHKKLIIHYMQPHEPFIGERGHQFMQENNLRGFGPKGAESGQGYKLYHAKKYGFVDASDQELISYYSENLKEVLDSVSSLVRNLEGKTVITADHGELIGDTVGTLPMKGYGHPKLHVDGLLTVPWYESTHEIRRRITTESPIDEVNDDTDSAIDRLESLGYH